MVVVLCCNFIIIITISSSLASFNKSRLVLLFWYRLTQVVLEKRPFDGCSSSGGSCVTYLLTVQVLLHVLCQLVTSPTATTATITVVTVYFFLSTKCSQFNFNMAVQ